MFFGGGDSLLIALRNMGSPGRVEVRRIGGSKKACCL